jgi:predicted nucleic acid-binding protein
MIVVADTSPLNYFLQISCESLLPSLYQRVLVPPAVLEELAHPDAPKIVANWLLQLPGWIERDERLPRQTLPWLISTLANAKRFGSP